jgi:hypothetical protein
MGIAVRSLVNTWLMRQANKKQTISGSAYHAPGKFSVFNSQA